MLTTDLWQKIQDYFFSAYENSLFELAIFIAIAILFFSVKHLYSNYKINKIRRALPLVAGGWGTRGKSGTERIKAAMFNAMGYSVVSKTTGCEAMFLYAVPYGKMREMFLFRPYDKATIWEQYNVMQHAADLKADVFLWECMALTPSYVKILQQHWVRDDISTITNTYPDHEDLQGPAGINIPGVMTNFIPQSGILLTTEEQMRPILSYAAKQKNTRISGLGWLESGLLTPDILQRFPYEEHPDNIALVLQLAKELGVEQDFALKEMADRVVADLGVLKTFPVAHLKTRKLQFTNGMSANERFGCLSNWKRMGFDQHDEEKEPGVWISAIVNNRADRIARSRVFASILVTDISADKYFLIGSNLPGLLGYIDEAWKEFSKTLTLWPKNNKVDNCESEQILQQLAQHYHIAFKAELVIARLQAMLAGQPVVASEEIAVICEVWETSELLREKLVSAGIESELDSIMLHHERNKQEMDSYHEFLNKLQHNGNDKELNECFKKLLYKWFVDKIVVIDDYFSTGDALIQKINNATPPGYLNRIMGLQNIKGTGLDFVYRWQAWDVCHLACSQLHSKDQTVIAQNLRVLTMFKEYGLLCEEYVRETIEVVKHSPHIQRESFQAELILILSNLDLALVKVNEHINTTRRTGGIGAKFFELLEAFLDAGDAVKRRKTADKIYKDLVAERISLGKAVIELQGLNKRQKGGWLTASFFRNKAD